MATIKLKSPQPRTGPIATATFTPPISRRQYLPIPDNRPRTDLFAALARRRSQRTFEALTTEDLSRFLWFSARTRGACVDRYGERREFRPSPSAGACHPHDLLVIQRPERRWKAFLYDSRSHALDELSCAYAELRRFVAAVEQNLPILAGTIVWMAGRPARTERYYSAPESLIWRDAGALVGVMAVVASGLNLHFCPLGMTGEPFVSSLLRSRGQVLGFGGILIGQRPSHGTAS